MKAKTSLARSAVIELTVLLLFVVAVLGFFTFLLGVAMLSIASLSVVVPEPFALGLRRVGAWGCGLALGGEAAIGMANLIGLLPDSETSKDS